MRIFLIFLFYFGLLNYLFSQEQKIAIVKIEGKVYKGFISNDNKPKDFLLKTIDGDVLFFEYNKIDSVFYSNELNVSEIKPNKIKITNPKKLEQNYTIGISFFPHVFKIIYEDEMANGFRFSKLPDKRRLSSPFVNLGFIFKENHTLSVSLGCSIYTFNDRISKINSSLSYNRSFRNSILQSTIIDRCFIREIKGYRIGIIGGLMLSIPKTRVLESNQIIWSNYSRQFQMINSHLVIGSFIERKFKTNSIAYLEPTICLPLNFVSQELEFRFKSLLWGFRFGLNIPLKFN